MINTDHAEFSFLNVIKRNCFAVADLYVLLQTCDSKDMTDKMDDNLLLICLSCEEVFLLQENQSSNRSESSQHADYNQNDNSG